MRSVTSMGMSDLTAANDATTLSSQSKETSSLQMSHVNLVWLMKKSLLADVMALVKVQNSVKGCIFSVVVVVVVDAVNLAVVVYSRLSVWV